MDLFKQLDKIDQTRQRLYRYEVRLRRLFFARTLRDRQLSRITKRWRALSDERAHILGLIAADPVLKQQFEEREHQRRLAALPHAAEPDALRIAAADLAAYYAKELIAKQSYQDAVAFAKWADGNDDIPHKERTDICQRFLTAYRMINSERLSKQKSFEDLVATRYLKHTAAIAARDRYMREAILAQTKAAPTATPFQQWYAMRTKQPVEKTLSPKPPLKHAKRYMPPM